MVHVHQEVRIKKDVDVPRLKNRLRPIIMVPLRKPIQPVIKEKIPLYIDPLPIKPILLEPVEPPLKEQIDPVIPKYIGDPDEQPESIREEPDKIPATDQSRETFDDDEDTPRSL